MRPAHTPLKLTYEDYLGFPQDGKRHELIDGEHYVSPSPTSRHQSAAGNLYLTLGNFVRKHGSGRLFFAPLDVVLSDVDVVEPDLLFISCERLNILKEAHVAGAPDLVVEVLSPGSRRVDAITKRHLYEKFGVAEYWLVDPELEKIEVYRLANGALERQAELSRERDEHLTSPLFSGLSISLREIFTP
ncbi:MAG: Uma2 family endonuclease [Acidobacteriota bacterium]|nr:Uma2 family endonuclease [Acidobacteriota bacterium]